MPLDEQHDCGEVYQHIGHQDRGAHKELDPRRLDTARRVQRHHGRVDVVGAGGRRARWYVESRM